MRDTQKESDVAEVRYRAAFALLEQGVREDWPRPLLRLAWSLVDDALDDWRAARS